MSATYTAIRFDPTWEPPELALDYKSGGFFHLNEITVALTGVFARNGQLIGLSVNAEDGRRLMLPLIEIPRSAQTLMHADGLSLGEFAGQLFAERYSKDDDEP